MHLVPMVKRVPGAPPDSLRKCLMNWSIAAPPEEHPSVRKIPTPWRRFHTVRTYSTLGPMAALEEILQRHPVWLGRAPQLAVPAVPTGYQVLDSELPGGGWPAGALTEILSSQEGIGE